MFAITVIIIDFIFVFLGLKMINKAEERVNNPKDESYFKGRTLTPSRLRFNGLMLIISAIMMTLIAIFVG